MRRSEYGGVFLLTLAVMAGLVLLVSGLAASHQEHLRAQENRLKQARAKLLSEAAIQRAIAELQQQSPSHTYLSDPWATLGNQGSTLYTVGNDSFRLQVLDTCSQADVNAADQDMLKKLPLTEEQLASLMDWRETNKSPRGNGAKDDYYNSLTTPYNAKLQPFDSVEELLLVRGFTPESLYSPPSTGVGGPTTLADLLTANSISEDKDLSGNVRLDANSASIDQLEATGIPPDLANAILQARTTPFKLLSDVINVPQMTKDAAHAIADNLQVGTNTQHPGLINVNTATAAVLNAVPNLNPDLVAEIVDRQSTGFKSLGELLDLPGMDLATFARTIDRFCVSSRTFEVRAMGVCGQMQVAVQVFVMIGDDGQVRITRIQPEPFLEARKRWNWNANTSDQEVIGGGP